jgi:hypothetical protein
VTTPYSASQADLDYLLDYAREDWLGLSVVTAISGATAGKGATLDTLASTTLSIIGDLIDRGAVPGNLTEHDPGFEAWSGTKDDWIERIATEIREQGRLPETGEVCWIHALPSTKFAREL